MREVKKIGVVVLLIVLGLGVLAYGYIGITGKVVSEVSTDRAVKVGFMGPLTGDASGFGQNIKNGVELALEDSGLQNVKLVYEDSGCEGSKAASAAQKLIKEYYVIAIIGEVCSGATLASAPIAEAGKVVMISASSTSPKISEAGDYIFRTVPSDTLQGEFAGKLIYEKGFKTLAILHSNEDYGVGLEKSLRETFQELEGQIVSTVSFNRGQIDMELEIEKIQESWPEAIYIISNSPDSSVVALAKIKNLQINASVFGSEGLLEEEVLSSGFAENITITSLNNEGTEFARKYRDVYGEDPGPFAAQGYDAFSVIAYGLKKGVRNGEELRQEIKGIKLDGVSGLIEFDENGDIVGEYRIYEH
jgi:branched-chain amino acid transport system substrate-binding protein